MLLSFFMIKIIIPELENSGVKNFFLEVRESNIPAIKLYEKFEFKIMGVRKNYYHSPAENAIVMGRLKSSVN